MRDKIYRIVCLSSIILAAGWTQVWSQQMPAGDVISRSAKAVNYQVGGGSTTIDFKGTELAGSARGEAKVQAKKGVTEIQAKFAFLPGPTKWGMEFLTYVLWAVSPEGRSSNLGEILIDKNGNGKLNVSTPLQVFSLVVTAEPYFGVRQPSELVVLENEIRKNTKGKLFIVDNYTLMKRAQYQKQDNPLSLSLDLKNVPLEMYQARNAVQIAKMQEADRYAPDIYTKAEASLKMAENALAAKKNKREILSTARQTVQFAEDARSLAVQKREEERLAAERRAAEEAQRQAQEKARQEELQRAQAEAGRMKAEAERAKAEAQQAVARQKADEEARLRAEAEAARARAEAEKASARQSAEAAEQARRQAEEEKAQLRARLLQQFNQVLETRDTERGLVVNMSDVLFDTGKYTLRPEAREKLARIAGIILNYPDLKLEAEGHTDNTGSAEFNQKLSEQRADSVRQYLISQGIPQASIGAVGRGFTMPVATNDTAAGRQQNRRVELIVSGEVIGTAVRSARP